MAEELCKHTNYRKTARICEMRQIIAKRKNEFLSKCYHCEEVLKMKDIKENTKFSKRKGDCVACGAHTDIFVKSSLCLRCAAVKGVKSEKRNPSTHIALDFTEHTLLLQTLKEDARENFRDLKPHLMFILTQYCKNIKKEGEKI